MCFDIERDPNPEDLGDPEYPEDPEDLEDPQFLDDLRKMFSDFKYDPGPVPFEYWTPVYLLIDESDRIFVCDSEKNEVFLLDSQMTDHQSLITKKQYGNHLPCRCFYRSDEKHLIIGHRNSIWSRVSVLKLIS